MKPEIIDYAPIEPKSLSSTPRWNLTLKLGKDIMNKHFNNWQLGFGTLLGAVRNGTVIPHDIDLDIDLILYQTEEDKIPIFRKEMLDNNFIMLREQKFKYIDNILIMSLAFKHKITGVIFDVCIFRKFGTDFLHIGKEGMVIRPSWTEKKRIIKIKEEDYFVPKRAEDYLTGRYGNWKIPCSNKGHWYKDAAKGNLFIPINFEAKIRKKY